MYAKWRILLIANCIETLHLTNMTWDTVCMYFKYSGQFTDTTSFSCANHESILNGIMKWYYEMPVHLVHYKLTVYIVHRILNPYILHHLNR